MSQTFLDLSAMLLREGWDVNFDVEEVKRTMEEYFGQEYDSKEVESAIKTVVDSIVGNRENYPSDDYTY